MQAATVVVGGGACSVGQGDIGTRVHRVNRAAEHFDNGVIRSSGGAVSPRCVVAELECAVGHGKLTPSVGPRGDQSTRAAKEPVIELTALGDNSIDREGIASRHINATTKVGVCVVIESDAAVSSTSKVQAQC